MIGVACLSLLVAFSGAVVPGPLFVAAVNQALLTGWTAGFWLITGHFFAELLLLAVILLGLGRVLQRPAVTRGISIVGGLVLLYFAWDMVRLALHGALHIDGGQGAALSPIGQVGQGFLLSLLNPYWLIWWATAGISLVATAAEKHGRRAWPAFFLGHISADYLWYLGITILAALGSAFLNEHVHRGIILVCGIGLGVLGLLFLFKPAKRAREHPIPAKTTDATR